MIDSASFLGYLGMEICFFVPANKAQKNTLFDVVFFRSNSFKQLNQHIATCFSQGNRKGLGSSNRTVAPLLRWWGLLADGRSTCQRHAHHRQSGWGGLGHELIWEVQGSNLAWKKTELTQRSVYMFLHISNMFHHFHSFSIPKPKASTTTYHLSANLFFTSLTNQLNKQKTPEQQKKNILKNRRFSPQTKASGKKKNGPTPSPSSRSRFPGAFRFEEIHADLRPEEKLQKAFGVALWGFGGLKQIEAVK